jgi:hypothetical protein
MPAYATFLMHGFKVAKDSTDTVLPLKAVSRARIDLDKLRSWGATETRWLSANLLRSVNMSHMGSVKQHSSPALSRRGAAYGQQLVECRWAERVPRKTPRGAYVMNRAFPVAKGGTSVGWSRWVMDCLVNRCEAADAVPTSTTLARIEDVHDAWIFFRGGREDDGVSFYGQFELHPAIRHLFAFGMGSVVLAMCVMPQGWAPATRIAQQALGIMYSVAYWFLRCRVRHKSFMYIDNALTLSCSSADDEVLKTAARRAHSLVGADFQYGDWGTAVSFTGYTLVRSAGRGRPGVMLKASWKSKASMYMGEAVQRQGADALAMASLLGVMLWIVRVLRIPYVEVPATMAAVRRLARGRDGERAPGERHLFDAGLRREMRRVAEWIGLSRPLIDFSTYALAWAASDATPTRVAAMLWEPVNHSVKRTDLNDDACDNVLCASVMRAAREAASAERGCPSGCEVDYFDADVPRRINGMELIGVLLALVMAPTSCVLAVFTDSQTAKAWVRRGITAGQYSDVIVRVVSRVVQAKRIRLLLGFVPGVENPCDKYSRSDAQRGIRHDEVPPWQCASSLQVTAWI